MIWIKCLVIFIILVSFNDAHRGGRVKDGEWGKHGSNGCNNLVSKMCSGATNARTCRMTAMSCFFKLPNEKTSFCFCKGNVTGVSNLYTTWVDSQLWGRDMCSTNSDGMHGGHSGKHYGRHSGNPGSTFVNYLVGKDAAMASNFQCCIGQKQGLYLPNGSANITSWKQQASAITNATVLTAVNNKIDSCGSSVTACNATAFFECVVQGCYNTIKV